jgi:hypothetical protein
VIGRIPRPPDPSAQAPYRELTSVHALAYRCTSLGHVGVQVPRDTILGRGDFKSRHRLDTFSGNEPLPKSWVWTRPAPSTPSRHHEMAQVCGREGDVSPPSNWLLQ